MSKISKLTTYAYDLFLLNNDHNQLNVGTYYYDCDHVPLEKDILDHILKNATLFLNDEYKFDENEYGCWTALKCQKMLKIKNKSTYSVVGHLSISNIRKI